jgi:hypothetical protein
MSQVKNSRRKADKDREESLEDYAEASYAYSLMHFEEALKSVRWGKKVWSDLSNEAKEKLREFVALEKGPVKKEIT